MAPQPPREAAPAAAGKRRRRGNRPSSPAAAPPAAQQLHAQSYDMSRLLRLPYTLVSFTAQRPGHEARHVANPDNARYWSTGSGAGHCLKIRLERPSLVGFLRLFNRSVSALEVAVAQTDRPDAYVTVYTASGGGVPHNKVVVCRTGFLPCRYVRLTLRRGSPVSLYSLEALGIPTDDVEGAYGAQMRGMLVHHPRRVYFGPVLPRGAAVPESQWRSFPLGVTYPPGSRATSAARHRPADHAADERRERAAARSVAERRRKSTDRELARLAPGLEKLRRPCMVEL